MIVNGQLKRRPEESVEDYQERLRKTAAHLKRRGVILSSDNMPLRFGKALAAGKKAREMAVQNAARTGGAKVTWVSR